MFFFVRKRPATLHSFLNVYRAVLTDLNVYLTGFTTLNVYLAGLLQYIFFHFFFICNVLCSQCGQYCSSTTLLVHWFMLASCMFTDFLFACCCCSCFPVGLVAVCTLGVLQPRLELPFCRSPLTGGFGCRVYFRLIFAVCRWEI
jgi:hypothetical protein